ncbi:MAG: helix-turn-helix transcriptional regulator [Rhodobacter sp.]|uniref:helix-turn-helix transcriptional regulator n=1 Tax=Pararhodobacter sp. TaxID=2127056 RepID=UPI001D38F766|nr:helix-turn-helix transcriptional regulator [Pararhodobacter sp.]MCB1345512.1 helix-turn-helix transcriptional regulator [Paracoccaceae bacterium]MCC0073564.1 helix-turn-helix transcriptional regulator [Rhodobacter sp.]HPD92109.1 helix-turn-helix transcriptional regulator [Pararhodobacter sp.]
MKRQSLLAIALLVQACCTVLFVADILGSVLGIESVLLSWQTHELLEIGALLGLVLGFVLGALALLRAQRDARQAEAGLKRAQSAFAAVMDDRFDAWGLTPAERDVALFAIKGMTTAEIAGLRGTSEGTVKAQSNAIYRKAGVSSRSQLLGLFIEDLVGPDAGAPPGTNGARA